MQYRKYTLPADTPTAVNVIPREVVNSAWEQAHIPRRDRHEFRYLFPKEEITAEALDWAEELKHRAQEAIGQIKERVGDDGEAFNKELGKLYDLYRLEIQELFPTPEERRSAAAACWSVQHTRPELERHRQQCLQLSQELQITFGLEPDYQRPTEAIPRDTYVLSVPFDRAAEWMDRLEARRIQYDAVIHPHLPLVEFGLKELSARNVEVLEAKFGSNLNDIDEIHLPEDLRIVPSADFTWAHSRFASGTGALAYNLFTEEICQQLRGIQIQEVQVLGISLQVEPESICLPELSAEEPEEHQLSGSDSLGKMQHQLRQALKRTCQLVDVGDDVKFPVGEQWMAQVAAGGEYWVKDEAGETVCRGNLHTAEVSVLLSKARAKELEGMLSQQHQLGSRSAERYQPTVSLE